LYEANVRAKPHYLFFASVAIVIASFILSRWPAHSSASTDSTASKQPVIVELFTSEGCSSCPPADSLLKKLSEDQPFDGIEILALEEHVDYWNTLGWSDPFSSVDFSRRQEQYAVSLPDGGIYTPQMIVDGAAQFVGNRTHESRDQIRWAASHPKSRLLLTPLSSPNPHTRTFQITLPAHAHLTSSASKNSSSSASASANLDLWIALTEKNLSSNVTAGENSGHTLQHAPIVRLLRKQQSFSPSANANATITIDLNEKWNPANLTAIAFLSDPKSHQIQAAGSSSL
jgi:hypothetical protein